MEGDRQKGGRKEKRKKKILNISSEEKAHVQVPGWQ